MPTIDTLKGKIRRTHIIAFSVIAFLMTAYFAWTQQYLVSTQIQPKIINIAGKQRMLSQRMAFLQTLLVAEKDKTQREALKAELLDRTREFLKSHEVLVSRQSLDGHFTALSPDLESLYFSPEINLDKNVKRYAEAAMQLASASSADKSLPHPTTLHQATTMLSALDNAVRLFEEQLSREIRFNQWMLLAIWVITMSFALIAVILLFSPLKKLVFHQFTLVQEARQDVIHEREQANKLMSSNEEFLTSMSRLFRAPISAIIGTLELLPNAQDRQLQLIQKAENACYRLLMLTTNMLESMQTKIPGALSIQEDVELIPLLDDAYSEFFYECQQKNINYQVINETTLPIKVRTYPMVVLRALHNVLDNAVKFTQQGSVSVYNAISIAQGKRQLEIRVVDTGIGIREEDLERIFERFTKVHDNPRLYSGAGIGLYTTRLLLDEIGGSIHATSVQYSGTELTLYIPLDNPQTSEPEPKKPSSTFRFAVVDDQEITRLHLTYLIEAEGYEVDTYHSGVDLLANQDKLRTYDGIISDYYMPGINGIEMCNYLSAMMGKRMPPVIMVSASPQIANLIATSEVAVWQVLVKPIDKNRFLDSINYLAKSDGKDFQSADDVSILIVEDEPINAEILRDMVENMGYVADVADDGNSAIARATDQDYDIILLDLHLPDIIGFDVAERLKASGCQAKIVAITASHYEEDKKRSQAVGMRYHLVKPVAYQELKNTLKLLLNTM